MSDSPSIGGTVAWLPVAMAAREARRLGAGRDVARAGERGVLEERVVIESEQGGGGTAFGHCLVRGVPDALGACQFTGGSGSLKGFKADVRVTTVDGTIWHWRGATSTDN